MIGISSNFTFSFLRISLGIVFFWFGILKLFNVSPVLSVIKIAMPAFLSESQIFFFALSFLEILIGLALLSNKFVKAASLTMILHLLIASISVLFTQGFDPRFPILSLVGEFVVKNLVLIAGGFILLSNQTAQEKLDVE